MCANCTASVPTYLRYCTGGGNSKGVKKHVLSILSNKILKSLRASVCLSIVAATTLLFVVCLHGCFPTLKTSRMVPNAEARVIAQDGLKTLPLMAPFDRRHTGLIYWPRDTRSWKQFFYLLCFTPDGLGTLSLISVVFLVIYFLLGRPLSDPEEDARIERQRLWEEHEKRFTTQSGFVGGVRYEGKRETMSEQDLVERKHRYAKVFHSIPVQTVSVDLDEEDGEKRHVKVTIAGDRTKATLTVITHHDICTNFRHGFLPFSLELLADLHIERENGTGRPKEKIPGVPASVVYPSLYRQSLCFVHVSAPGHVEGESTKDTEDMGEFVNWNMDSLAARMNKIITKLGITGR